MERMKTAYGHIVRNISVVAILGFGFAGAWTIGNAERTFTYKAPDATTSEQAVSVEEPAPLPPPWPTFVDQAEYNARLLTLANVTPTERTIVIPPSSTTTSTTTTTIIEPVLTVSSTTNVVAEGKLWPPAAPLPYTGAILPYKRILAYYGNFYSRQMGILGEYEPDEVLARLASTTKLWEEADPSTPVIPAIQYIAMVAQAGAGRDGMYRAAMPDAEIEKAYEMAKSINGILFIDLQVGLSTIERELPQFKELLSRPDVHLAIDPEFSMKTGARPGTVIGTFTADDVNFTINWLADIVREYKLPPKVLVVHRFTENMLTGSSAIRPQPEVQVVINMDGWGSKELKRGTYGHIIEPQPVQFAGIKLFYKNDLKPPSTGLLTPKEVLELHPKPIYIQYQ